MVIDGQRHCFRPRFTLTEIALLDIEFRGRNNGNGPGLMIHTTLHSKCAEWELHHIVPQILIMKSSTQNCATVHCKHGWQRNVFGLVCNLRSLVESHRWRPLLLHASNKMKTQRAEEKSLAVVESHTGVCAREMNSVFHCGYLSLRWSFTCKTLLLVFLHSYWLKDPCVCCFLVPSHGRSWWLQKSPSLFKAPWSGIWNSELLTHLSMFVRLCFIG